MADEMTEVLDTVESVTGAEALSALPMGSINAVLWISAAVALVLFVGIGMVSEIAVSRRRDIVMRVLKISLYITLPVLAVLPALTATAGTDFTLSGALIFYVVFFAGFCYYLGKRIGRHDGQRYVRELVGMESGETVEEAQDRLFESRMRFATRSEVVDSIAEMAKAQEAERLDQERGDASGRDDEVSVVAVEATPTRARQDRADAGSVEKW